MAEAACREFIDNLVSILKIPALNHAVKSDILKYIQNLGSHVQGKPSLSYVGQVYKTLKNEGTFATPLRYSCFLRLPRMRFSSKGPCPYQLSHGGLLHRPRMDWLRCGLRCRTSFMFTNRKHHCCDRGQIFDHQCSSKLTPLPHSPTPLEEGFFSRIRQNSL